MQTPFSLAVVAHQARLPDRMRERLLAIHMLAQPHGHHRRRRMMMVGSGNNHGVDLRPEILEQLAIIEVLLRILELLEVLATAPLIDVANRDDLAEMRRCCVSPFPFPPTPMQAMFSTSFGPTPPAHPCRPLANTPNPATEAPYRNDRRLVDGIKAKFSSVSLSVQLRPDIPSMIRWANRTAAFCRSLFPMPHTGADEIPACLPGVDSSGHNPRSSRVTVGCPRPRMRRMVTTSPRTTNNAR